MSRTLKWILGIIAVLVVVAVVVGGVWFLLHGAQMMAAYRPYAVQPNPQPGVPNVPNGPRGFGNNGRNPMCGYGYGLRGPMMGRGFGQMMRFGPFGLGLFFFGGLLRWFLPLILIVLVAVIFYQLGKRSVTVRHEPAPATNPPTPPAEQNPPQS